MKENKILLIIVFSILIIATFSIPVCADIEIKTRTQTSFQYYDWPMFRHDINRTGASTSNAPNSDNILWTYSPPIDTWFAESSPVVSNGKLYIGACEIRNLLPIYGKVICLDENTGETIWTYNTDGWVCCTPSIVNSRLYFGTYLENKIHCIDAINGNYIWSYQASDLIFSSPIVDNGKLYIGSFDGKMYCINADTGTYLWDYQTGDLIISSPTVYNNKIYFGSTDSKFYCLDSETGGLIWRFTGGQIRSTPAIYSGNVYFGSGNKVYCFNADNGSQIWNFQTGANVVSSPGIAYDKLYIGSYDYKLYCLNPQTGSQYWNYSTDEKIFSSPAVADNKVYVSSGLSEQGNITCLNADDGNLIWSKQIFGVLSSSPAIANGKLFQCIQEGELICFSDNNAPNQPEKPDGPQSGKPNIEYEYITRATDLDGDQIRYGWDWNSDKEVDEWTSYYLSDEYVTTIHSWGEKGIFFIRVIAEDENGLQSEWSKPLTVTLPRNRLFNSLFLLKFIEILDNILNLLII